MGWTRGYAKQLRGAVNLLPCLRRTVYRMGSIASMICSLETHTRQNHLLSSLARQSHQLSSANGPSHWLRSQLGGHHLPEHGLPRSEHGCCNPCFYLIPHGPAPQITPRSLWDENQVVLPRSVLQCWKSWMFTLCDAKLNFCHLFWGQFCNVHHTMSTSIS